ncbi:hypothetical protein ACLQ2Q_13350 [Microbacterium sp. DT81.1]|uniref:hypothetical protein n=1 Tax=Microbacterium sp. DT81.1 TaxID=3393413 RepID=UPI003CE75FC9
MLTIVEITPIRPISRIRFNAFVSYARSAAVQIISEELAWFEVGNSDVFATLLVDNEAEFAVIVFAADLAGKYRWVNQTLFASTPAEAMDALPAVIAATTQDLQRARVQGDESQPVDFFTPVVPETRLDPVFRRLLETQGWAPAREMIGLLMRWYENQDGNFVQQFQSDGFDARLWELYTFAVLVEAGFDLDQPTPAPDFEAVGLRGRIFVEATTLNPSRAGQSPAASTLPTQRDELAAYIENYIPIRFARSLMAKLRSAYWTKSWWRPLPFVIAVQDFHAGHSMTFSAEALRRYLYALGEAHGDSMGPQRITEHAWGNQRAQSGFFDLPGAEHVSAVLFNPSGTLAKFNRMGAAAGLGGAPPMIHSGLQFDAGRERATRFAREVGPDYSEGWIDGTQIFHNPRALHPLDPDLLPDAAHVWLGQDGFQERIPDGHLLMSVNAIVNVVAGNG